MAYVDLKPDRAKMASTPEEPDFTSVQQRISHLNQVDKEKWLQPSLLLPFTGSNKDDESNMGLAYNLYDYLALVD